MAVGGSGPETKRGPMRGGSFAGSSAIGWVLLQVFALGACGGKSVTEVPRAQRDTSAIFGSGTRLKAHYLDGGGGARQLVDFHDTELNTTWQFVESASGQYHCLPTTRARHYFDSTCSEPAYVSWTNCGKDPPSPGLLVSSFSPECEALAGGYSLVEERTVSTIYSRTTAGCEASDVQSATAWSLVRSR
jgi:hypothetical protein